MSVNSAEPGRKSMPVRRENETKNQREFPIGKTSRLGETLETSINGEQARGQRFNCRLRTNNG